MGILIGCVQQHWHGSALIFQKVSATFSLDHVLLACLVFLGANASLPGAGSSLSATGGHGDGDNLLDPSAPLAAAKPTLTVDWPKSPVSRARFHSYTSSGRSPLFGSGGF